MVPIKIEWQFKTFIYELGETTYQLIQSMNLNT